MQNMEILNWAKKTERFIMAAGTLILLLTLAGCTLFGEAATSTGAPESASSVELEEVVSSPQVSVESTETPVAAATGTPSRRPTLSATTTPTKSSTRTPTPGPINTPPEKIETPTSSAAPATPTTASASGSAELLPAPTLLAPTNGLVFSDLFDADQILLKWSPPKPGLGPDELYLITIQYNFQGETYTDYAWTQQPQWSMGEHSYLGDLSEDGLFRWSVVSIRQTGTDGDGVPVGPALSQASPEWSFVWQTRAAPSNNDDDDDNGGGGENGLGGDGADGIGGGYP